MCPKMRFTLGSSGSQPLSSLPSHDTYTLLITRQSQDMEEDKLCIIAIKQHQIHSSVGTIG